MMYKGHDDQSCSTFEDDVSDVEREPAPSSGRSSRKEPSLCGLCRCVTISFVLVVLVCGLLVYYLGGINSLPEVLQDVIPDKALFNMEDLGQTSVWMQSNGQSGLELTLINALDAEWYPYFYRAVEQWDAGSGSLDSLTLSTYTSDPDSECSPLSGFIKVYNGNYGNTDWKGINKVILKNDKIESSVAQMNEYYFGGNDGNARQYTMCHEVGHGFGYVLKTFDT
jgi:hypothetical protein